MTVKTNHSDLLAQLEAGITRLTSSEAWRDHLAFQSRFHRYSYGNVLLIAAQAREATQVAGFHTWRRLNRVVRKGETAIWIMAPMVGRAADGDGSDERIIRGFRPVAVFDISQTVGQDPPSVCQRLTGEDPSRSYDRLLAVADGIGFSVTDHVFADGTNGDCSMSSHCIRIEASNAPAQRVKTLAHEITHALLHETVADRALAELEAESTAYIVCQRLGLDSADYSFGYVATWAGGAEQATTAIKASCARIQKAAATILEPLADPPTDRNAPGGGRRPR